MPLDFGVALDIETMLGDGRHVEATRRAILHLRQGHHSPQFLALAADIMECLLAKKVPRARNASRKKYPLDWYQIGRDFYAMRSSGVPYNKAYEELELKYPRGERTLKATVKFYDRTLEEVAKLHREEWNE
jgi:hypothetical protein